MITLYICIVAILLSITAIVTSLICRDTEHLRESLVPLGFSIIILSSAGLLWVDSSMAYDKLISSDVYSEEKETRSIKYKDLGKLKNYIYTSEEVEPYDDIYLEVVEDRNTRVHISNINLFVEVKYIATVRRVTTVDNKEEEPKRIQDQSSSLNKFLNSKAFGVFLALVSALCVYYAVYELRCVRNSRIDAFKEFQDNHNI